MKNYENLQKQRQGSEESVPHAEVVKDGDGNIEHVFIVKGYKKLDLREFLPEGVVFTESGIMTFFPGKKADMFSKNEIPPRVAFSAQEINTLRGRLALLHEIGHAIDETREDRPQPEYYRKLIHLIDIILKHIRNSEAYQKLEKREDRESYIKKEFEKRRKGQGFSELESDEAVVRSVQQLARDERNAWANALRLYRKIKKEKGVDLLEEIGYERLTKMVEAPLLTYQDAYGTLVPEQQIKLFLIQKYSSNPRASNSSLE